MEDARQQLQRLIDTGRTAFFAVDSAPSDAERRTIAYVVRISAPSDVEAFARRPQGAGRVLLDVTHITGSAGDLVVARISESVNDAPVTLQYQFLIVRGPTLHALFVEIPAEQRSPQLEKVAGQIGASFTPIGD